MRPVYIVSPILQPLSETRSRIVGYSLARWTGLDREHIGDFPTRAAADDARVMLAGCDPVAEAEAVLS